MGKYFSASASGFFDEAIHGARRIEAAQTAREIKAGKRPRLIDNPDCRIPADAIEISDREHAQLMAEVAKGKQIVAARSGRPVAVDQERSAEDIEAARRRQRDTRLANSDWTQLPDTLLDQPGLKAEWAAYREALRNLDMVASDWPAEPVGVAA
ncbi:MAG: phage tail assembly chaperone [Blastomonas sp.]